MRWLALSVVLVALGAVTAWETLWRLQHLPVGGTGFGKHHVAQVRSLPESSELPYGQGIFVRYRFLPIWATSRLVFAAYCAPGVSIEWSASGQLAINCDTEKGRELNLSPPVGVTVVRR